MELDTMYSNIEAERARNRWSIAEISQKLGIDEQTYRRRLANARDISITKVVQYADLFNCSVDYLLGIENK